MATGPGFGTNVGWDFSFPVTSDWSSNQFTFVTYNGTTIALAGAGALALGIAQDNPNGSLYSNVQSQVRTGGPSKIKAGGSFSAGDKLSSNGSGQAVAYTAATVYTGTPYTVSGTQVLGLAMEPSNTSSGYITSMLFRPSGLSA